jgi:Zn-finger nucleic acid-binding protein
VRDLVKHGGESKGGAASCPRCGRAELRERAFVECRVLRCASCEGTWVPRGQASALQASFPKVGPLDREGLARVREAASLRNLTDGVRYLACPICQERMDRRQFSLGSAIIIARGLPHGVWFDGGEIELAATYFAVGGPHDHAARQGRSVRGGKRGAPLTPAEEAPPDPAMRALIELLTWLS